MAVLSVSRVLSATAWISSAVFAFATCGGASPYYEGGDIDTFCQRNPRDCFGEIGGICDFDEDCDDGVCCRNSDCGGGTCTYLCDRTADCPREMRCDDGHCFFACNRDSDCAGGQECKRDETVCQYD
jgi:hypothetical protein